jgi:hypothetical protein
MLDGIFLDRLGRLVQTEFTKQRKILPKEFARVLEEMAGRNSLRSGATLREIHGLCVEEVDIRSKIVWKNLQRVHKTMGAQMSSTLADDLKIELKKWVCDVVSEVEKLMKNELEFMRQDAQRLTLDEIKDEIINELGIEVDLYVDSRAKVGSDEKLQEAPAEKVSKGNVIFISHAAEDAVLAETIKTQIDNVFEKKVNVFVSSIPGTISPGSDWLGKIIDNLTKNNAFIVLVTPYSEKRPFVWFEIGFSWLRRLNNDCEIYAICAPPINTGNLPEPLCRLQATSLGVEKQTRAFFDKLTKQFDMGNLSALEINKITNSLPTYSSHITETENRNEIILTGEAKTLLLEAANDRYGRITKDRTMDGTQIQTNGKKMISAQEGRIVAKWEHALNELVENDFAEEEGSEGFSFKITHQGYEYAGTLQDKSSAGISASGQQDNLEFEKVSGTYVSRKNGIRYCHKCWHSSSKRVPLKEQKNGWRCNACDTFYSNPNYDRPTHTGNKRHPMMR